MGIVDKNMDQIKIWPNFQGYSSSSKKEQPFYPPGLNSKENQWSEPKRKEHKREPKNLDDL